MSQPAEDDVVEAGQRHEILDQRRPVLGAFPEANRAHLGERPDGFGQAFPNGHDAGNCRGADGPEADEQNADFSAGRSNGNTLCHGRKLYHCGSC